MFYLRRWMPLADISLYGTVVPQGVGRMLWCNTIKIFIIEDSSFRQFMICITSPQFSSWLGSEMIDITYAFEAKEASWHFVVGTGENTTSNPNGVKALTPTLVDNWTMSFLIFFIFKKKIMAIITVTGWLM